MPLKIPKLANWSVSVEFFWGSKKFWGVQKWLFRVFNASRSLPDFSPNFPELSHFLYLGGLQNTILAENFNHSLLPCFSLSELEACDLIVELLETKQWSQVRIWCSHAKVTSGEQTKDWRIKVQGLVVERLSKYISCLKHWSFNQKKGIFHR